MKTKSLPSIALLSGCCTALLAAVAFAAPATEGMTKGKVEFKSLGPIAFGPEGILFAADSRSAAITAIATEDTEPLEGAAPPNVEGIDRQIAAVLGTEPDQLLVNDMAVNPASGRVYLAVSRGRGDGAVPVLLRLDKENAPEIVDLSQVLSSRAVLPDAPPDAEVSDGRRSSNPRLESITDIAFFEDRVLVAGLSNEEFSSAFRAIPFPFRTVENGTSVEIYHGAHGRFETRSPVRTFVPFVLGTEPHLLAAYTCTPLVQLPIKQLVPGAQIKGKTIAELGNRNRPLDMIVYKKDGKDWLLLANSSRGVMKIETHGIEESAAIEEPVSGGGIAGLPYETLSDWEGIEQLDRLDDSRAVVLRRSGSGSLDLAAMALP
ncbi:MAG TPA: hypothetical protein VMN36_01220 [Verrucomicrobiales bacterium]|nr:hypothetical protein [Verrucomicrobiales bacterium]